MKLTDPAVIVLAVVALFIAVGIVRKVVGWALRSLATLIGFGIVVWLLATLTGHPLSWPA